MHVKECLRAALVMRGIDYRIMWPCVFLEDFFENLMLCFVRICCRDLQSHILLHSRLWGTFSCTAPFCQPDILDDSTSEDVQVLNCPDARMP